MRKHVCDIDNTRVIDSRPVSEFEKYGHYWRRRVCRKCYERLSTIEITQTEYDDLTIARDFMKKLASFAEELKQHGTNRTTV